MNSKGIKEQDPIKLAEKVLEYLRPLVEEFGVIYLILTLKIINTRQMLFLEIPQPDIRFEPIELVLERFIRCTEEILYKDGELSESVLKQTLLTILKRVNSYYEKD